MSKSAARSKYWME